MRIKRVAVVTVGVINVLIGIPLLFCYFYEITRGREIALSVFSLIVGFISIFIGGNIIFRNRYLLIGLALPFLSSHLLGFLVHMD